MIRRTVSLDGDAWEVKGYLGSDGAAMAARRQWDESTGWLAATVPGSVVADLWRAGEVPDPYVERNSLAIEWVPERAWLYRRRIPEGAARLAPGERAWLQFDGIDHAGEVYLDGEPVGRHEGMFVPFEVEVGERVAAGGGRTLAVLVEPAPATEPQTGRTSRVRVHKSRVTYGWDFSPRMIHQGLWQPVRLEIAGAVRITDVVARPVLAGDLAGAAVTVEVALDLASAGRVEVAATIAGFEGRAGVASVSRVDAPAGRSRATVTLEVDDPPLWWTNGAGPAPVGRVDVAATAWNGDCDERSVPIGFRRLELIANEGAPAEARPYTFAVNGRRTYAKGWTWVPHDVLYGVRRPDRVEHLVRLAAGAGVNLLRVWGGGLIETPAFYDACDRHGILVWQEFIQSSSGIEDTPSADPDFVALMAREAEAIVPLRRNHPSLALWCGGNELQDDRGPVDDARSPVLGALHEVVARLDPGRAWLPTSPTGPVYHNRLDAIAANPDGLHDVHGPWEHQGLAGQYELYNRGTSLLNSEFGVEGMTNRRTHEALIAPEHRWPAGKTNPVYRHLGDWWNNEPHVQVCFGGRITDLETLRRASQHLQADGLRYAIEANRRRWPRNSGSLPWQFNEPYPFAWSTCAVDHRGDPKPAYHAVRRAYAPVMVGAAFDRAALDGAATFEAELWALSEHQPVHGGRVAARLVGIDGVVQADDEWRVDLEAGAVRRPGRFRADIAAAGPVLLLLDLVLTDAAGETRAGNRYWFSTTADLGLLLEVAPATLDVGVERDADAWTLRVQHAEGPAAIGLTIADDRPIADPGWAEVEDGAFDLLPDEARTVRVVWAGAPAEGRRLSIGGWNVDPIAID